MSEEIKNNSFMDTVRDRRSVRNFDSRRPVSEEDLQTILEAARLAPSSNNTQPWHFVVVRDEARRNKLANAAPLALAANRWMRHAPVIIVCCGKPDTLKHNAVGQVLDMDLFRIDVAIAVEHMVLAARDLNLGTCWIGWFDERRVRRLLAIPSRQRVLAVLPIGYPRGKWPPAKDRKPLHQIVSYEKFGQKNP